jgi:hypothetical protein
METIIHPCPRCGQTYQLDRQYLAQYGGQATTCTGCGGSMLLPTVAVLEAGAQAAGSPVLGYAAPRPVQVAGGLWQQGNALVAITPARLPACCVKCGGPPAGRPFRRILYWHHPALYLTILAGVIIYAIVAMCVRQKGTVEYSLCAAHRGKRRNGMLAGWGLAALAVGMFVAAVLTRTWQLAPLGVVVLIAGCVVGIVTSRVLTPQKMDRGYMWLKGAGREFLATLPAAA